MRLRKPALVAVSAVAVIAAICGVLLSTQAAFTARTTGATLPITAGRLAVELTTSSGTREPVSVDLSEVGPEMMWPEADSLPISLDNTGDLDCVLTRLETVEVRDGGPEGAPQLSRVLEVAVSGDPAQDWHDPALEWHRVATEAEPEGRSIASELGDLPVGATRTLYLKVRFGADEAAAYSASTAAFRLVVTVRQLL
ncbi:hypothetical protein [Actinorugispora endophytica]|nr:hypothetical protein [Actinorugispora endophytica]